jgi:glycine cleavage system H protein
VSDCFSPVSGKVIEVNDVLKENPETINQDCYGEGWMIKIRLHDESSLNELMSHEDYQKFIQEES